MNIFQKKIVKQSKIYKDFHYLTYRGDIISFRTCRNWIRDWNKEDNLNSIDLINQDITKMRTALEERINNTHKTKAIIIGDKEVEIDIECINLVKLFNQEGIKTKFSCQGDDMNNFSIMFDDEVTDSDIENFISRFKNKYGHSPFMGKFSKWCRLMNNKIAYNWIFSAKDYKAANATYLRIKAILEGTYDYTI